MELAIKTDKIMVGGLRCRFAALGRRLVRRGTGVVWSESKAGQTQDAVAAHRRLEREAFGAIGLGGRGLFS
jgi:hypothetical protein